MTPPDSDKIDVTAQQTQGWHHRQTTTHTNSKNGCRLDWCETLPEEGFHNALQCIHVEKWYQPLQWIRAGKYLAIIKTKIQNPAPPAQRAAQGFVDFIFNCGYLLIDTLKVWIIDNRLLNDRLSDRANARNPLQPLWWGLGLGFGAWLGMTPPALAAEEIRILYGPIQLSVSIDSLETFANEGIIEPDLEAYANRLDDQRLAEARRLLRESANLDQVALTNFLYTPQGEALLGRVGDVIRTRSNSGFYALRAALILTAGHPEGATPLGLLQEFPTYSIVVDIDRALEIVRQLDQLTNVTSDALSMIETQFRTDADLMEMDFSPLSGLRFAGPYTWTVDTLTLDDPTRDRVFDFDLYLPNTRTDAPVIVISHGLGSNRTSFRYLAEHLASYGFAVMTPEHPGSNADYVQALFEGAANQVSEPDEFVDRSLDISFMLDDLARRSQAEAALQGRLDLNRVGIVGQSFGGYTALSLGGAEIDFRRLEKDCPDGRARRDTLNLSLLLQCRAADLQHTDDSPMALKDDRVKAVIAISPIGSTVFGPEGFSKVDVPVLMMTGSADVVAPSLFEQIFPFSWLDIPNKYLVLMRKATHFSTIGASTNSSDEVALPTALVGPDPQLAQAYAKTLSVAFLKTYLSNESEYQTYLSPASVDDLSREPLSLSIVQSLSAEQLAQLVKDISPFVVAMDQRSSNYSRGQFD